MNSTCKYDNPIKKTAVTAHSPPAQHWDVFGWGREGHETIAKIAERNLTKKAKKRIENTSGALDRLLRQWMDEYRHTPEYKFTNNWHTAPVNAELRYEDSMLAKNGNAIYGLEQAIENLKNYRSLTDSAVEVNLKYIIHLVGDMHCPAHIKYTTHDMKYDVLFEDKYHKPHKFPIHSVLGQRDHHHHAHLVGQRVGR